MSHKKRLRKVVKVGLAVIIVTYILSCFASAQTSSTTLDSRITLIGLTDDTVKDVIADKLVVDEVFTVLEDNTWNCLENCSATYVFHNPLNQPLQVSKKGFKFFDGYQIIPRDDKIVIDSINYYNVDTRTRIDGISEIPANGTVAVRIKAHKTENTNIDWIPYLCIDAGDFAALDGKVNQVCMSQNLWALWGMIDTGADPKISTSPVVYYNFDLGGYPTSDATDQSGNSNDGLVKGCTNTTGVRNNAILFDGVDDNVTADNNGDNFGKTMCNTNGCTVSLWTKYEGAPRTLSYYMTSRQNPAANERYFQFVYRPDIPRTIAQIYWNGSTVPSSILTRCFGCDLADGDYHHLAFVYNGSSTAEGYLMLYYDGVLVNNSGNEAANQKGQITASEWAGNMDVLLGTDANDNVNWNGSIDEYRVFNYELTPKQIQGLYDGILDDTLTVTAPTATRVDPSNVSNVAVDLDIQVGVLGALNITYNHSGTTEDIMLYNDSLVLFYDFEESLTADHSNYENDATNNGGVNTTGKYNGGIRFPNAGNNMTYSVTMSNASYSYGLWFNATTSANNQMLGFNFCTLDTFLKINQNDATTGQDRLLVQHDNGTQYEIFAANINVTDGNFHHGAVTYDGSTLRLYVDGVERNNTEASPNFISSTSCILGNNPAGTTKATGTIDNYMISSKAWTASEVAHLYQTDLRWRNDTHWTLTGNLSLNASGTVNNGTEVYTDFAACDTAGFCESNTNILLNVSTPVAPGPSITFDNQVPADIDVFSQIGTLLNISYNITAGGGNNLISNTTWTAVNKSSGCWTWTNGSCQNQGNTSNNYELTFSNPNPLTFNYSLDDNEVYPGTYPLQQTLYENNVHSNSTISNSATAIKCKLYNISTTEEFALLEYMIQGDGGGTAPLEIYTCNSSYTTGRFRISPNCVEFYSTPQNPGYNHSHGPYSSHNWAPFAISSGEINGLTVTEEMQFIWSQNGPSGSHTYSYLPNIARADTCQTTGNAGISYSNLAGTLDYHMHQYDEGDAFSYFIEACDDGAIGCTNSSVRYDKLNLLGISPTVPDVYNPTQGNYSTTVVINYTQSTSPNQYPIITYNISLFDENFIYQKTLVANNTPDLGYTWDSSGETEGLYHIGVYACDNQNQCSNDDFSDLIQIDLTNPLIAIDYPQNTTYNTLTRLVVINTSDDIGVDTILYSFDNDASNTTYTTPTVKVLTSSGPHIMRAYVNDTAGNWNQTSVIFQIVTTPPNVTGIYITKTSVYPGEIIQISSTVNKTTFNLDKFWFTYNPVGNISDAVEGNNTLSWVIPYVTPGNYTILTYANDTIGSSGNNSPAYIWINSALNQTQSEDFNNLIGGKPFQAIRDLYTGLMGSLFWLIILGGIYFSLYIKTENMAYPTLWLIVALSIFNVYIVEDGPNIQYALFGVIAVALALVVNKVFGSSYTE